MLFILAHQILSANIKKNIVENSIRAYKVGRHGFSISRLLHADNILLFIKGIFQRYLYFFIKSYFW